jgi:hypothetical protein
VEGNLEPKLEHYETSKTFRKNKRISNYNPSNHIEDYIMWNTMENKI